MNTARNFFWSKIENVVKRAQVAYPTEKSEILNSTHKDFRITDFFTYINDLVGEDFYHDNYPAQFIYMNVPTIDFIAYASKLGDNYLLVYETCSTNPANALHTGLAHQETDLYMHTSLLTAKTLGNIDPEKYDTQIDNALLFTKDIDILYNAQQKQVQNHHGVNLLGFRYNGNETNRYKNYATFSNTHEEALMFRIINTIFSVAKGNNLSVIVFAEIAHKYPIDAFLYYVAQLTRFYPGVKQIIFLDHNKFTSLQLDQLMKLTQDS